MTDVFLLVFSLAGGFGAGVLFFGGLWLTVRRLDRMKFPALIIPLSSIVRVGLVLIIFWWFSRSGLLSLGLALVGFIAARFVLLKAVRGSAHGGLDASSDEKKPCI